MDCDVVVVGGANTDYLAQAPALPGPGASILGTRFQEAPGGKGVNQAVAAARLGARTAFVGRVGLDERGRSVLQQLATERVDVNGVVRDPAAATGAALIMVRDDGEKQTLFVPGANRRFSMRDALHVQALVARARVLLVQLEIPVEAAADAVRRARASGARVVLDPAPAQPLPDDLLRHAHVVRPNAAEAQALTGIAVRDHDSARAAAEVLLRRGAGGACVASEEGNLVLSAAGELWLPHLPVASRDSTGAGDAFAAALAVMLGQGQSLEDAARFASAAAAVATTRLGALAGLPTWQEVLALLERFAANPIRLGVWTPHAGSRASR